MNLKPLGANKTEVDLGNGRKVLFSYQAPVAYTELTAEGRVFYKTEKKWSNTTTRHISSWMPVKDAIEKPQEFFDVLLEGVK